MLHVTFDTTFFMNHYFSSDADVLGKTREILRRSRFQGNRGIVPTIVLAEFYAQAAKKIGAAEAERRFNEIANYGLEIADSGYDDFQERRRNTPQISGKDSMGRLPDCGDNS